MTQQTLATDDTDTVQNTQDQATTKTFTQEEVNAILARTKGQLEKKYQSRYEDLGDPEELRQMKAETEQRRQAEQLKRGEFERTLKEIVEKKDAEISRRDSVIKEYKVNTPLVSAAAKYRAVNVDQVKALLSPYVRLNTEGDVEVTDDKGSVRYSDSGSPFGVEDLVKTFLESNPHFQSATPATTHSKSNVGNMANTGVDITQLDMKNPEHRKAYAQYRKSNGLA